MKTKSITKNYFYNTIYQLLSIIVPLITTPYVSRVLGANNIGIFSYTLSITTYFILFGSLGIALYGQREIAYIQDDKRKYTNTFWEIVILRCITMLISSILFFFNFVYRNNIYSIYYMILIIELFGNTIDISWFFQGLEEFKKIVIRNLIIKLFSVACIFAFVKSSSDLYLYFIIYTVSTLIGNASLWLYLPKFLCKTSINQLKIFRHLKPTISLFIPQIAIQIYTVLDKVMIGSIISDKSEVGYYEQAQKITKMLLSIVASLGTVMMPRIANSFAQNDKKKINEYMKKSLNATLLLSLPIIFGLIAVSKNFVPIFFGKGYEKVGTILNVISPIILMIGLSGNIGTQYLLPTKQQNKYTISVIIGASVNFVLNMILIPKLASVGAAIGTVVAETMVTMTQIIMTRKQIEYKKMLKVAFKYLMISVIMFCFCELLNLLKINEICCLTLKAILGSIIYLLLLIVNKDEFTFYVLKKLKIIK